MIAADDWLRAVTAARDAGFSYFDWLGCVDEIGHSDTLRIVLVLRDLHRPDAAAQTLETEVPRDHARCASLSALFAGAGWHEREAAELFGVEFVGGDRRRLLLPEEFDGTPLRKDDVLAARAGTRWPGAKDPGESTTSPSRRRMVPPGVPDPQLWGDRDPVADPAAPGEVAESAVGGRVRRSRG